jgi:hypothetical protein
MDWTNIITTLLTLLIPTGGLVAIVTMTEKKSAMMLENAKELAASYKALAEEYQERENKTQQLLVQKEDELMTQIKMNSSLRHALDDAHTETAVARLMYCKKAKCVDRDPPFGSNADNVVEQIKGVTRNEYQNNIRRRNGREDNPDS